MPRKPRDLTAMEYKYIGKRAELGNPIEAARAAGYKNPSAMAARLENRAQIIEQVQRAQLVWLAGSEGAQNVAHQVLLSIMRDDGARNQDKIRAADIVLKQAHMLTADGRDDANRSPDALSLSQIDAQIARLEAQRLQQERELTDVTPKQPTIFD